jgi:hypothetical protein
MLRTHNLASLLLLVGGGEYADRPSLSAVGSRVARRLLREREKLGTHYNGIADGI